MIKTNSVFWTTHSEHIVPHSIRNRALIRNIYMWQAVQYSRIPDLLAKSVLYMEWSDARVTVETM